LAALIGDDDTEPHGVGPIQPLGQTVATGSQNRQAEKEGEKKKLPHFESPSEEKTRERDTLHAGL
jgi:hypothetical protein